MVLMRAEYRASSPAGCVSTCSCAIRRSTRPDPSPSCP